MAKQTSRTTNPSMASESMPLKPGDEAPAGTPGTGENICPVCHGRGSISGRACTNCSGTGKITTAIGGA